MSPEFARHCHTCGGPTDHKDRALVITVLEHYAAYCARLPGETEAITDLLTRLRSEYIVDEGDVRL